MTAIWQRLTRSAAYLVLVAISMAFAAWMAGGCGGTTDTRPAATAAEVNEAYTRALLSQEVRRQGYTPPLAQEIAASFWRSGQLDSSRVYLEMAVTIDPHYVPALTWLSRLYYEQGEIADGIALLEPVIFALTDPDPELLANLSVLRLAWGDVGEAESLLRTCQVKHPTYAPAYGNLGYLYLQLGDVDRAETELRAAIAQNGEVPEFHNNLGIVYRRAERFEQAADEFAQAIAIDPEFREAHHNLALLYKLYLYDDQRARRHFRSYLALGGRPDQEVSSLFRRVEESP
jgi:Flp pilus assembly protein TadD